MNVHVRKAYPGYGILIDSLTHPVEVRYKGKLVARSTNAKVMYETRMSPAIYVPADDVIAPLPESTDQHTFCPFKGTASYFDLRLPDDEILTRAAWSYRSPFKEAQDIANHVSFYPRPDLVIDTGENDITPPAGGDVSGPLINWLVRDAAFLPTPEAFTEALCAKLIEQGVALSRLSTLIWSLHPMIAGKSYTWSSKSEGIETFVPTYEIYDRPAYRNSPLRHVSKGLGGVRHRLTEDPEIDAFPVLDDLRQAGATDYVAMPLHFSDGRINVLTIASDHPQGFTTANLGLIYECSAVIARYYEVFAQRENARAMLETYVGKRSGARVLGGEIRRGDGDEIDAAIMFCDLRGSTLLQEKLGRAAYISVLNTFFERTSDVIETHSGEVLKFIGDAVLAVFPAGEDAALARRRALGSAHAIVEALSDIGDTYDLNRLECAIGIAYGSVTYGNVGSKERLDFTVIGRAANIAARLGEYGKSINAQIVVSQDCLTDHARAKSLGPVTLHNVSQPVQSYSVDPALMSQRT